MVPTSPPSSTRALEQRRLAVVRALQGVQTERCEQTAVTLLTERLAVQDRQLQELRKTVERLVLRLDRLADELELLQRQQEDVDVPVSAVPDLEADPLPRRPSVPPYEPAQAGDSAYDALLGPAPRRSACA